MLPALPCGLVNTAMKGSALEQERQCFGARGSVARPSLAVSPLLGPAGPPQLREEKERRCVQGTTKAAGRLEGRGAGKKGAVSGHNESSLPLVGAHLRSDRWPPCRALCEAPAAMPLFETLWTHRPADSHRLVFSSDGRHMNSPVARRWARQPPPASGGAVPPGCPRPGGGRNAATSRAACFAVASNPR